MIDDYVLRRLTYAAFFKNIDYAQPRQRSPFVPGAVCPIWLFLPSSGIGNKGDHAGIGWSSYEIRKGNESWIQRDHSPVMCGEISKE